MTVEEKLRESLPDCDFAVLRHGFASYMRDYVVVVQIGGEGKLAGTHECLFTHCVLATVETRVRDDVWPISWADALTDYEVWLAAGAPEGYVWGTCWSLAYPGLTYVSESRLAAAWSARLGQSMHEATIETDGYLLQLVFHDVRFRLLSDDTSTVDRVVIPIQP